MCVSAVDIEKPPAGWTGAGKVDSASTTSTSPSSSSRRSHLSPDSLQWDRPKWIEFHAPNGSDIAPFTIPIDQTNNNTNTTTNASTNPNSPPLHVHRSTSPNSPVSSSRRPPSRSNSPVAPPLNSLSPSTSVGPTRFTPTLRQLPLDTRIMRSAFVCTSQPLPLPQLNTNDEQIKLVTVTTKTIGKAKL